MSNGFLSSSKSTLIFAAGVVVVSVLIGAVVGPNLTPTQPGEPDAGIEIIEAPVEPAKNSAPATLPAEGFAVWADDADLVDDTAGFSPDPTGEVAMLEDSDEREVADDAGADAEPSSEEEEEEDPAVNTRSNRDPNGEWIE